MSDDLSIILLQLKCIIFKILFLGATVDQESEVTYTVGVIPNQNLIMKTIFNRIHITRVQDRLLIRVIRINIQTDISFHSS